MRISSLLAPLLVALGAAGGLNAATGGMMVEVYAAGSLEKLQLAQGSYVEDYDDLNLRLSRVGTSWVWYDGEVYTTAMYQGFVVTSSATDYVPYTVTNVQIFQGTLTKLKHYLNRPVLHLAISPNSVTEGGSMTGTITLKNAAGANVHLWNNLTLNLSSTAGARATLPASVTIPNRTSSATFTISAVDNTVQDGNCSATLTATAGWGTVSAPFTVINND